MFWGESIDCLLGSEEEQGEELPSMDCHPGAGGSPVQAALKPNNTLALNFTLTICLLSTHKELHPFFKKYLYSLFFHVDAL